MRPTPVDFSTSPPFAKPSRRGEEEETQHLARRPPALGFRSALLPCGRRVFLLSPTLAPAMAFLAIAPGGLQNVCRLRTRIVLQTTSLQGHKLRHSSTCYTRELLSLEAARGAIARTASKHSGGGACALALGLSGLLPLD